MLREEWNKDQVTQAITFIKDNYIFIESTKPASFKQNRNIFSEINKKYENMFKNITEIYLLSKNKYKYPLFCPVCGKRNHFEKEHCSCRCTQLDKKVREKNSNTKIQKYGNAKYNNMEKHKQTCLERFGRDNYFKGEEGKKAAANACERKHGNKKFRNHKKRTQTCLQKIDENGLNSFQRSNIKRYNTMLSRYNVRTPMESKEIREQHILAIRKKYNVDNIFQLPKIRERLYATKSKKSKLEREWLLNMGVEDTTETRQRLFLNYLVDGFKDNIIYEFLGNFYHGNPRYFNVYKDHIQKKYKKLFEERFLKTEQRFKDLYNLGYQIIYCWEYDYNNDNLSFRKFNGKLEY